MRELAGAGEARSLEEQVAELAKTVADLSKRLAAKEREPKGKVWNWRDATPQQRDEPGPAVAVSDAVTASAVVAAARRASQDDTTRSRASASTACKILRKVDSPGVRRPIPSRTRTETGRSWAHSAIAT